MYQMKMMTKRWLFLVTGVLGLTASYVRSASEPSQPSGSSEVSKTARPLSAPAGPDGTRKETERNVEGPTRRCGLAELAISLALLAVEELRDGLPPRFVVRGIPERINRLRPGMS